MPLGMEVGLHPGDFVLHGNSAPPPPPKRGAQPHPSFVPCLLSPNGWMDQEFKMPLSTEVGLSQGDFVLDGDPALPPKKGAQPPPVFGPCLL